MNIILDSLKEPSLITHLEGNNNYSWIYFRDGRKVLLSKTLYYFEKRLPDFMRVHKTAMVNANYIKGFTAPPRNKMQAKIHLFNGLTMPVGRRRWGQLKEKITAASQTAPMNTQAEEIVQSKSLQRIYVVIADQIKASLVEQLAEEQWSKWQFLFFGTEAGLLKALSTSRDTELPAIILLHTGQESAPSLVALRSIKNNVRFRLIPTLLVAELQNHDLAKLGYESGANSVILQSVNFSGFVKGLEKVFRYWLTTASAPNAMARVIK